jgi:hypothetical protein
MTEGESIQVGPETFGYSPKEEALMGSYQR